MMGDDYYLKEFAAETSLFNDLVLGSLLPESWWSPLPHFFRAWLRSYIGAIFLYFFSGIPWCLYIYGLKRKVYFPNDAIPSTRTMLSQIYVSMKAIPWYSLLPTLSEYMIENGWTMCFTRISDVGWLLYTEYLISYVVLVEFILYWVHRELHDIKPLYKYLHSAHHIYNKQATISPFAGMAFQPLDGVLQGVPLFIPLFLVPMHFRTHIVLSFVQTLWTTNNHDCIHATIWPFMGAGYHTLHHTTSRHNYGNYTIWMDWMFGTLREPPEDDSKKK